MGKLNEIQQQSTQSYGSNSFTTKIEENTVVFDSAKDNFKFNDPVDVPELTINGQPVEPGGGSTVEIQDLVEPSERAYKIATIKVDDVDNDIYMTDKYNGTLTIASPNSPLTKYVFITGGGASNPGITMINGSLSTGIAQYTTDGIGVGTGKKLLFPEIEGEQTIAVKSDIVQSDWNQNDSTKADFIKNRICSEEYTDIVGQELSIDATTGQLVGAIDGNYYFNPTTPFIAGATYQFIIGGNVFSFIGNGTDDTTGSGSGSIIIGGMSLGSFSLNWDTSGISGAPNNETACITCSGIPIFLRGMTVKFLYVNIKKIPMQFLNNSNIENGDGAYSTKQGYFSSASGSYSFASGVGTQASGAGAHTEGNTTEASGASAHAEGNTTNASGDDAHAEGYWTNASGDGAHAEGNSTTASGEASHAEGNNTEASGDVSHAEGRFSIASGEGAHAECVGTTASGVGAHAEGNNTEASGDFAHAEGASTIANHASQHVFGEWNIPDNSSADSDERGNYVEIVGNGTDEDTQSNARTLDWNGNEALAGTLRLGSTSTGGAILKVESNSLKISFDNGTTWQTVTLS